MIIFVCCRKEEMRARLSLQAKVTQDETVLALQKKLKEKQQEHQRLKQAEGKKTKTPERPVGNSEIHNRVSMKALTVPVSVEILKQ